MTRCHALLMMVLLACLTSAAFAENELDAKTRQQLQILGHDYLKSAPAHVKQGNDLVKARYVVGEYCTYLAKQGKVVNSGWLGRLTQERPDAYTCGDLTTRAKALFAGAGLKAGKVADILAYKPCFVHLINPNRNHGAVALIHEGRMYIFDPWQHAVGNGEQFSGMDGSKWNGMPVAEWGSEMRKQGYSLFSCNEGYRWEGYAEVAAAACMGPATKPTLPPPGTEPPPSPTTERRQYVWVYGGSTIYKSQDYNLADYSKQSGGACDGSIQSQERWTLGELSGNHNGIMNWKYTPESVDRLVPGSKLGASATMKDSSGQGSVGGWIAFQTPGIPWNMYDQRYPVIVEVAGEAGQEKHTSEVAVPVPLKAGEQVLLRATVRAGRSRITYDRLYEAQELPPAAPFAGKWQTAWGVLELTVDKDRAYGTYTHKSGKVQGVVSGDGRVFRGVWLEAPDYAPPRGGGAVVFTLDEDGRSFRGKWWYGDQPKDGSQSRTWDGTKLQ
ncbi:MAG: hypothetical protein ABFE07_17610 [Armatimonadia bacterium]